MRTFTTMILGAIIATLTGCVVAPGRTEYRDRNGSYDHQDRDRHHYDYRHNGEGRSRDGDHAGGTGTPD
jgi:outer membrane biogenesis lipoprotein LolB